MRTHSKLIGIVIAGSLMGSSTGAVAATASHAVPQINPWAALTAMSGGAPAAALCGAAVTAAAQTGAGCVLPIADAPVAAAPPTPVPVPPLEPAGGGFVVDPLLLALGALAIGALVYFLIHNNDNNNDGDSMTDG